MKHWIWWLIAGLLSVLCGLVALLNPFAASLTAEFLSGWSFMLVGLVVLFSAFGDKDWSARIFSILLGGLILALGVSLVAHPLSGLLSLTYAAALIMMFAGILRLILAFNDELRDFRWVLILSGALSIVLAIMIFSNFPQSAAVVLGIYLAIELIGNGASLIAIALARRNEV